MGSPYETAAWGEELARIADQLDQLKARSDEEYRSLHAVLDDQIAELRAELQKLEDEVDALRPDAYAHRIATQIDELKAKGDAAYERLQASTTGPVGQSSAQAQP
jgi:predicted  nucleic acid-binding Zn-ribbon protein